MLNSFSKRYNSSQEKKASDKARIEKIESHKPKTELRQRYKDDSSNMKLQKRIDGLMSKFKKGKLEGNEGIVGEIDDAMGIVKETVYKERSKERN